MFHIWAVQISLEKQYGPKGSNYLDLHEGSNCAPDFVGGLLGCKHQAFSICYSCPMKMHHSSDAHICDLSKAVQNCVIYIYNLGQMRCFQTKISIPVTLFTHDVTSASKLR